MSSAFPSRRTSLTSILSFDVILLVATMALIGIGIAFIYSSGVTSDGQIFSREFVRQIVWAATGLGLLIAVSLVDYERLRGLAPYLYGAGILLLTATLFFGRVVNGARSWLGIGEFGVQPSEFVKVITILLVARYLESTGDGIRSVPRLALAFGLCLVPVILVLLQPDLGTALVYIPIFLVMSFVAGARLQHLFFVLAAGALLIVLMVLPSVESAIAGRDLPLVSVLTDRRLLVLPVIGLATVTALAIAGYLLLRRRYFYWIAYAGAILLTATLGSLAARAALREYQIMRLIVFLDPYVDPRGAGWHIIQSLTAVGSGGVAGKGFLQGTQSHYQYLPQQSTDFIFSILAEEWGFVGALVVFVIFAVVLVRGLILVRTAKDRFGAYLASGIIGMFFFHFVVNVGMAIGVMPITGIPLLFLSYGGSSLWTAMVCVGLLMSIHRRRGAA